MLSLLAKAGYSVGPSAFGLLSSALAVGAIGGALVGTRRTRAPSAGLQLGLAALFGALLLLVAVTPWFWLTALGLVPCGAFMIAHNNVANSRLQLAAPRQLRGRMVSLFSLSIFSGVTIGASIFGRLADAWGVRSSLAASAASVLVTVVVLSTLGYVVMASQLCRQRCGSINSVRLTQYL